MQQRAVVAGVLRFPQPPRVGRPAAYALAVVVPPVTAAIQHIFVPEPSIAPFVLFYLAVTVVAWLGGSGPGLLATPLSAALANYHFIAPFDELVLSGPGFLATLFFLITAALAAALCGSLRQAMDSAEDRANAVRRAEQTLRDSEERFRNAIMAAPFPAMIHAEDGQVVAVNETWTRLTGYTRDEVPTVRVWTERAYGDRRELVQAQIDRLYRLDRPIAEGEFVVRTKGGAERIWEFGSSPLGVLGGQRLVVTMALDVTDRKEAERQLRESEGRFQAFMANSPAAAWLVDREGRFVYVSPTYYRLFEVGYPDLVGKGIRDVYPASLADEYLANNERALTEDKPVETYEEGLRGDGSLGRYLVYKFPFRGPHGETLLGGMAIDVTERQRAEDALREAGRRKDEFLAMLSHELRNPLAPIKNSLYVLGRATPGSEQAERARAVINRQVDHLARLVNDLLDVTRIARGKIQVQREKVDLALLVQRTLEDHRSLFERTGIALEVTVASGPLWVCADPTRLAQAVGNLLQNAAKFTPPGGTAAVTVAEVREARQAMIRVRDSGTGLAPDVLARLFEPFMQGEATIDRSSGGLGLGLALTKGLVELHGGTVSAASEGVGKGAEFAIRLPLLATAARPAAPAGDPEPRRTRNQRILVIEDNVDAAESLREALQINGYEVEVAHEGREGLETARRFRPEVILCDVGLPGMDGYEVARTIRSDRELASIRLVALTGYATASARDKALGAGFDEHVGKPPDIEKLEGVLHESRAAEGAR